LEDGRLVVRRDHHGLEAEALEAADERVEALLVAPAPRLCLPPAEPRGAYAPGRRVRDGQRRPGHVGEAPFPDGVLEHHGYRVEPAVERVEPEALRRRLEEVGEDEDEAARTE